MLSIAINLFANIEKKGDHLITKPSLDELIVGLIRNLEKLESQVGPDYAPSMMASLSSLDRLRAEWQGHADLLREENEDIRQVLLDLDMELGIGSHESDPHTQNEADVQTNVSRLEAENRDLKTGIVRAIEHFNLPPGANGTPEQFKADERILPLILRILHREDRTPTPMPRLAATAGNPENKGLSADVVEDALYRFFKSEMPHTNDIEISELGPLGGGASREAWVFNVSWQDEEKRGLFGKKKTQRTEECIMLREPVSSLMVSDKSASELTGTRRTVGTEVRSIEAMDAAGVPVASILWADTTGKWMDRPFFISKRLPGSADVTTIVGTEQAPKIFQQYISILADIHTKDPQQLSLPFLGEITRENAALTQIELYERNYREQAKEPFPAVEYMIQWLKKNQPVAERISVVHGDYRLGNFMFDDTGIVGVIDWEQVHLGDPTEEIAFMFWAMWSLEALCPIDQFVDLYEQASGISIDKQTLAFYRVFIELKMFVVGLTGMSSFYATPDFQMFYGGGTYIKYIRDGQIRALEEFSNGGPSVAFDAFQPKEFAAPAGASV